MSPMKKKIKGEEDSNKLKTLESSKSSMDIAKKGEEETPAQIEKYLKNFKNNPDAYMAIKKYITQEKYEDSSGIFYRTKIASKDNIGLWLQYNIYSDELILKVLLQKTKQPLNVILKKNGDLDFHCLPQDLNIYRNSIDSYINYLPSDSGIERWLQPKTNEEIVKEVEVLKNEILKIFGNYIDKEKLSQNLLTVTILTEGEMIKKTGQPYTALCENNTIYINKDYYLPQSEWTKKQIIAHEIIHYLANPDGKAHKWRYGEIDADHYSKLSETIKNAAILLKTIETIGGDPHSHPAYKVFKDATNQMLELLRKNKALEPWLEEGATNLIAIDGLQKIGLSGENSAYEKETNVAKIIKDVVGEDIFYKAYFTGDLNILVNEFCNKKGIEPNKFYEIFGFQEGKSERVTPEDALKKLQSL